MSKNGGFLNAALRKYFRWSALGAAVAPVLLLGNPALAQDEIYTARTAVTLPGADKVTTFDISFVDPVIGLYLLADRTNSAIDVIDTTSNQVFFQATATPPFAGFTGNNNTSGPNGVTTVNHREIWAGDGPTSIAGVPQPGTSSVKVIDLFTQKTTHVINTGGNFRADELCFDPRDQLVMVANDAETPFPYVSLISTVNYSVLQQIVMNGGAAPGGGLKTPAATNGIEQCKWDFRTGNFYVNIPEVNGPGNDTKPGAVVVISPKTATLGKILNVWSIPLGNCAGPQGMAIGPESQILLGCNDPNATVPRTVIINDVAGVVIKVVEGEDGSDEVWYNEGDGSYFLARSGGADPQKLGIIDVNADADGQTDQDVPTGLPNTTATPHGAAHSVAADPIFNQIYVPIPSTAGLNVCSNAGASDSQGCIAVFTSRGTDDAPVPLGP
jgi:hypothetical protein